MKTDRIKNEMHKLIIVISVLILIGCSEHEFYSEMSNSIGEPVLNDSGYYLPISVKLNGIHSALWIHKVTHKIVKNEIRIKAYTNSPPHSKNYDSMNGLMLGDITKGHYKITYIDPDGGSHFIKTIEIK